MHATSPAFPRELTPATTAQFEDAMSAEIAECGLYVDDLELLETIDAIETRRPFRVHGQWLISTGRLPDDTIGAMSVDRTGDQVQLRRWQLSVALIYALLCEDAFLFPWRSRMSPLNDDAHRLAKSAA